MHRWNRGSTWRGYVVVGAEDHEAAALMFDGRPHFAIFPRDGVEVMPLLPVPTE
ncbi:MAG: hypothetical protein ACHP9T_02660 [Caulobacterales bacterium]|jgi:hypothetical protein